MQGLSSCCDGILDQRPTEGRVCFGSQFSFWGTVIKDVEVIKQGLEAVGHTAPTVRKQREMDV